MAEACMDRRYIDGSDDEEPLIFRKKATPMHSKIKNSLPAGKPDKHPGRLGLGAALNGWSSSALKGKSLQASNTLSSRSSRTRKSPSPSTRSVTSPSQNSTSSANHQPKKNVAVPVKEERAVKEGNCLHIAVEKENLDPAIKESHTNNESEDSDNDKPLSARHTFVLLKGNSNMNGKGKPSDGDSEDSDDDRPLSVRIGDRRASAVPSQNQKGKASGQPSDESDDEEPLSSKYQMKSDAVTSSSKYNNSDEVKPLSCKFNQNGFTKMENQNKKAPVTSAKRPYTETSFRQSSLKKVKQSHSLFFAKDEQLAGKSGAKDDDNRVPISQRINKPKSNSGSNSVLVKKAASSRLKKVNKKSKKIVKKSRYSRWSKELPDSGNVQKWTTLVHSGVIFPPMYQPQMLYDGKPVD